MSAKQEIDRESHGSRKLMNKSDDIVKREQVYLRFKNEEMDFMFNWVLGMGEIIGLSQGEIFYAIAGIKDGDPVGWREGFRREGHYLRQRARDFEQEHPVAAGHSFLAAAYAYRASLIYADPTEASFETRVSEMEDAFGRGTALLEVPLRAIEVPFEGGFLPGYYLEQDPPARPT